MSENLYNFLSEQGDYTKSYEDFQTQFSSQDSIQKLHNFMSEKGDYTKSLDDFNNQFFINLQDVAKKIPKQDWEVDYEYDRSKGLRPKASSYGKYVDDLVYKYVGNFLDITKQSIASGQSGEYTDEMLELIEKGGGRNISPQEAKNTIRLLTEASKKAPSKEIQKWSKTMEEASNPVYGFFKATAENPVAAYEAIISSIAGQAKALQSGELATIATGVGVGTGAIGSGIGPVGTVVGFLRGFMSTMGGGVETASKFGELIREEFNGEIPTEKQLQDFFLDEEKFNKFRNKALAKGATIAAVDNFGGGMVVKSVAKTAKKGKKALAATKGLVGESIVGGGGEALSSVVIGEEISAVDVGLEILGQAGQASVDVGGALITPGKYKVNGKKATLKEVNKILETATPAELVDINIEVENDTALDNEIKNKKNEAYLETQIDPTVSETKDRKKLVKLQQDKQKLEAKIKKGGIFKGVNAKAKLENINKEIDAIFNKYSPEVGPAVDPAGIEARTKTKEKARDVRLKQLKDEITKGVKQSRFYRKANIKTEEVKGDKAVEMFIEQEANNLLYDIALLNENLEQTTDAKTKRKIRKKIKEVEAEYNALENNAQEAKNAHGFLLENNATGEMTIVINTDKALSSAGNINVAAHELLHAVLRNTFLTETGFRARELKGTGLQTGQKLLNYLIDNKETELLFPGGIMDRLKSYAVENEKGELEYGDTAGQEVLNLLSDALVDINYKTENKTYWQGLGDRISDILQAYLPERFINKLNFGDGKQVFDFIKTFNKAITGDVVAGRIIERVSRRGIDTKQKPTDKVAKTPMSKEASDNVQRIYDEQGEAGAMDIIDVFKPITNKLVQRRSEAPNFDRQLLTDEIETGKRGIFDLIREYNPESGVPLAAYINKFLPARAIEASQRVLGEEFTQDVTEIKTVAAEEVTTEVKAKPKPKKIVLADRLNVKNKVNDSIKKQLPKLDVKNLTFKNLKNLVPEITGEMFGISPKKLKTLANITKKELQSSQMFISKNADLLINMLPEGSTQSATATGVPNSLLKAFYTKTDRAKMAKTGSTSGLAIQIKNKINKKQFLETFGIIDGKPVRTDRNTSARVLALANLTGKVMTNQTVRENLQLLDNSEQTIQNIKDGTSSVMFSKGLSKLNLPDLNINDPKNGIENYNTFLDKITLLGTYMPSGLIRRVDLYNFGITNQLTKEYAREQTKELGGIFTIGKSKQRTYLRPDNALGKNVKDITKAKVDKYNESGIGNFDAMVEGIRKAIEANPKDKQLHSAIYMYLSSAVNDTSHPLRTGAEYIGGDITAKGKIIYEHALQNASVRDLLMETLLNRPKDFNKTLKAIKKNYKLIALSEKDANAVDTATYIDENGNLIKYKNGMGVGWDIFVDNWFDRYFNTDVNAVDPNNIKVIENGKTFADEYSVTISGKSPVIKSNLKSQQQLSKAVNKVRTTPFSKEAKGITVLDFDDTLATTKSLVKYTTPNGKTGTLNAEQFASTYEDLQDQGYVFDFSDFNKVVKGKLAPLFQKALKLQGKFGPENMFVLTARPPAAQKAIFDFLKANGLNIPLKNH